MATPPRGASEAVPRDSYIASIDGQRCLRSEGRIRRLKLPLPAEPPQDVPPAACFLCHPERDRFDEGTWPPTAGPLRLVGNAHGFANRTLLLAPPGESHHAATPATLPIELLAALLRAPFDPGFLAHAHLGELDVVAFMNVGLRAAQSRRHPHLQIVGFQREQGYHAVGDPRAIADDLIAAAAEERVVRLGAGAGREAIVPRAPGMTAEVWVPVPAETATADAWATFSGSVQEACAVSERGLAGCYNLVLRLEPPRLLRLIPRGLSERAGLELALPGMIGSVIAAGVRETRLLWEAARDQVGIKGVTFDLRS